MQMRCILHTYDLWEPAPLETGLSPQAVAPIETCLLDYVWPANESHPSDAIESESLQVLEPEVSLRPLLRALAYTYTKLIPSISELSGQQELVCQSENLLHTIQSLTSHLKLLLKELVSTDKKILLQEPEAKCNRLIQILCMVSRRQAGCRKACICTVSGLPSISPSVIHQVAFPGLRCRNDMCSPPSSEHSDKT